MAQKKRVVVFLPVQLAHQFDALAVSLQTTRSALVTEALQTALPQLRASATARFISGEATPGPRRFWPRAGSISHTLVQLRQIVIPYIKSRPEAGPNELRALAQSHLDQLPAEQRPADDIVEQLLEDLMPESDSGLVALPGTDSRG